MQLTPRARPEAEVRTAGMRPSLADTWQQEAARLRASLWIQSAQAANLRSELAAQAQRSDRCAAARGSRRSRLASRARRCSAERPS